jgi:hypothetical protein
MDLHFIGVPLGYNAIVFFCLFGFILKNKLKWKNLDFKPLTPFLFLYFFEFVMIFFQNGMPFGVMINNWRTSFMGTMLLPFLIWNAYKKDSTILKPLRITAVITILVICIYGLFLVRIPGMNPYLTVVLPLNKSEFNDVYASVHGGRLFGRISSVFGHPMTFGVFLCMSFVFLYAIKKKIRYGFAYIIIAIIFVNVFLCGVRSCVGGVLIGIVTYLIMGRKFKITIFIVIAYFLFMNIVQNIPEFQNYIDSMADFNNEKGAVNGSSFDMRYEQFLGAVHIVKDNMIQGLGFQWTGYYLATYGDHPVCLAFESLIYMILCNNGILGFFAWGMMLILILFKKFPDKDTRNIVFTLIISYIGYSCITGDYGYMRIMLVFYILILMESNARQRKLTN